MLVRRATRAEQRKDHIDFWTTWGSVEFKAPKRIARADRAPSRVFTAIEVESAQDSEKRNHPGWVFGHAKFIVFEQPSGHYLWVIRAKLAELVAHWRVFERVTQAQRVLRPFTVYARYKGRRGSVVYMPYTTLHKLAHTVWECKASVS